MSATPVTPGSTYTVRDLRAALPSRPTPVTVDGSLPGSENDQTRLAPRRLTRLSTAFAHSASITKRPASPA
jgi:hypothetical protein